jgi:hypothetical protein
MTPYRTLDEPMNLFLRVDLGDDVQTVLRVESLHVVLQSGIRLGQYLVAGDRTRYRDAGDALVPKLIGDSGIDSVVGIVEVGCLGNFRGIDVVEYDTATLGIRYP